MAKDNLLARPALQPQGGSPARSRRRTRGSLMILAAVLAFFAIAGGITYCAGIVFHLWDRLRFQNVVWHVFVVVAAMLHLAAIFDCLVISRL